MLSRLTGITVAVIGFLGVAGYTALSIYLSVFGLDSSIATFGQYGFVHFGILVLAAHEPSVVAIISIFILLAYLSFRQRAADAPYDTVIVNRGKRRISFGSYMQNVFSDEWWRRKVLTFLDVMQLVMLVVLLVFGAVAGEQYGENMANSTIHGVALVENPNVSIPERVHLRFNKAANPSPMLKNANRLGRLSVVWTSRDVISVTAISNKPMGKKFVVRTWSIPLATVAQVDRVRTYSRGSAKTASKASVDWFWVAFTLAMSLVIVFALLGDYLRRRDAWDRIEPLDKGCPLDVEFPDVIADRASCALALGKDLRVVSYDGDERSLSVVRNSAFPVGHRIRVTHAYKNPLKELVGEFRKLARRFGLDVASSKDDREIKASSAAR